MTMPKSPERPSAAPSVSQTGTFDKIESIAQILEQRDPLTEVDLKKADALLTEITDETKKLDGTVRSFFNDDVLVRLRDLLPDHPFFRELNGESSEFINSVDLLIDGEESFERIIHHIRTAKKSITINIFIWRDDKIGNRIAEELLKAAEKPGMQITIVKDRLGSVFEHAEKGKQSFFHKELSASELQKASVIDNAYSNKDEAPDAIQKKNPIAKKLLNHPNITVHCNEVRSDHSKYYIFDDTRLITGGMNICDENHKDWHDYMIEADSPLLVEKFKKRLSGQDDFDEGSSIEFSLNLPSARVKQKEIKPMVQKLLTNAKNEVIIEMAYFGDADITKAIIDAANRGVDLKIIVPEKANIQDSLNRSVLREILQKTNGKATVYLFPKMLHAKLVHVDGQYTFLGSANLNDEATKRLGETNMLINDINAPFTQDVRTQLAADIAISKQAKTAKDIPWGLLDSTQAMVEQNAGQASQMFAFAVNKPKNTPAVEATTPPKTEPAKVVKPETAPAITPQIVDLYGFKKTITVLGKNYDVSVSPPASLIVGKRIWKLNGVSGSAKGASLKIMKATWQGGKLEVTIKGSKRIGLGMLSKEFSEEKHVSLNEKQAALLLSHLTESDTPFVVLDEKKQDTGVQITRG